VKSFPVFRIETTRACFHAGGKYCLRRTTLNTFVKNVIPRFGRSFKDLFVIQFGPESLPTLTLLKACTTLEGLINFRSLAEHIRMNASPH
jgi:hypothetical protein